MRRKGFTGLIMLYVGITIAVVLVSSVVMVQITQANTTGWDTASVAMWSILGLSVIAGLIVMVLKI